MSYGPWVRNVVATWRRTVLGFPLQGSTKNYPTGTLETAWYADSVEARVDRCSVAVIWDRRLERLDNFTQAVWGLHGVSFLAHGSQAAQHY